MLVVLALLLPTALAQSLPAPEAGFDAHGFSLAALDADPRDALTVQRPGAFLGGDFFAGAVFEYASKPLVFAVADPLTGEPTGETLVVLDRLAALNVSGGAAVTPWLRFDLGAPLYLTSTGIGEVSQGVGLGDLRVAAMLAPLTPDRETGGFGLGLVPYLDLPTGDDSEFLGQRGVSGGAKLAVTGEIGPLTLTGDVGVQVQPAVTVGNLSNADALQTGVAAGYVVSDQLAFTLEGHLASPFVAAGQPGTGAPGEALFSVRSVTASGGHFLAGAAAGVSSGASSAAYRVFVGGGYGRRGVPAPPDTDLDGIVDASDACVDAPETVNGHLDEDGCPDAPVALTVVVTRAGQPAKGAQVRVTSGGAPPVTYLVGDVPWQAAAWGGSSWRAEATLGTCLAGSGEAAVEDGAGPQELRVALEPRIDAQLAFEVRDPSGAPVSGVEVAFQENPEGCSPRSGTVPAGIGALPVGAGTHGFVVSVPGYQSQPGQVVVERGQTARVVLTLEPARVQVTATQIAILDKVYFETAKAIIKAESFSLLDEVAKVILAHPEVGRIEVAGHTDSQGSDAANLKLSRARAAAVRDYLVAHGVGADRLQSEGYGEGKPIDSNTTDAGRANNRRVEFNLIDAP
jgi:OOP family OmpA-OmpF porin